MQEGIVFSVSVGATCGRMKVFRSRPPQSRSIFLLFVPSCMGEPLDRVPPNPLLIFGKEKGIPLSADSGEGRRPLDPCDFLKKIE